MAGSSLRLFALVVLGIGVCHCQSLVTDSVTENIVTVTAQTTAEPEITEFTLDLYHRESTTSSIDIVWQPNVPKWVTIEKYVVKTTKKGSDSVTTSPDLPSDTDEFIVGDLVKDGIFRVCVIASIVNDTNSEEVEACMESFTIPYIRDDSMYMLAITIAIIGTLILIGYLTWRCAVSRAEKKREAAAAAEEEEEEEESDEDKKQQ